MANIFSGIWQTVRNNWPKIWQGIKRWRLLIELVAITLLVIGDVWLLKGMWNLLAGLLLLAFCVLIYAGYTYKKIFEGVGVAEYEPKSQNQNYQRSKTVWDWLGLLIIPLVLFGGAVAVNLQLNQANNDFGARQASIAAAQRDNDQKIAEEQRLDTTFQDYLDRMSDLLFNNKLRDSKPGDEVRNVARARTLTALHALDDRRNNLLIQFLREAQLLQRGHAIVDLSNADLSDDNLRSIDLSGIDLSRVKLSNAHLEATNLSGAFLREADLEQAKLEGANLSGAFLWGANLQRANLRGIKLDGADLSKANLHNAILEEKSLNKVRLSRTIMQNGSLHDPDPSPSTGISDLSDDAKVWRFYYDKGDGTVTADKSIVADPSIDETALQISLRGGMPLADVQLYQNLLSNQNLKTFTFSLSFYLTDVDPIQSFDFTTSQFVNGQRWEWALQWKPIRDYTQHNASSKGIWSLWTGKQWQKVSDDIGDMQELATGQWYRFELQGSIESNNTYYTQFTCGTYKKLINQGFAPVSIPGSQAAIGVQLDGNDHEEAYDMYVDEIALH